MFPLLIQRLAAVTDVEEPGAEHGDLLVDGIALGVCGTDREILAGDYGTAPAGHERLVLGHESLGLVKEAAETAPRNTAAFAQRVKDLTARIDEITPRVAATAAAQERVLADLAVGELEAQKQRLASYATQARFALASLYDEAAAGGTQ